MNLLLTSLVLVASIACGSGPEKVFTPHGEFIDLTHAYDNETVVWPTSDHFRLDKLTAGRTDKGYYYAANNFFAPEHGGTHIDAPIHFAEGKQTVDKIPLSQLIAEGAVVDVSPKTAGNPDYEITTDDLTNWERANGQLPEHAIVLFRTGFGSHWPDAAKYLGTAERGEKGVAALHFPGLRPEAAQWLLTNRSIAAVGIDTASIDHGQSTLYQTHQTLFNRNVPAFENLASLDRLPARGFFVVALPMKIAGGTGGPLRAVAIIPTAR